MADNESMAASNEVVVAAREERAACMEWMRSQSSAGRGIAAMWVHILPYDGWDGPPRRDSVDGAMVLALASAMIALR